MTKTMKRTLQFGMSLIFAASIAGVFAVQTHVAYADELVEPFVGTAEGIGDTDADQEGQISVAAESVQVKADEEQGVGNPQSEERVENAPLGIECMSNSFDGIGNGLIVSTVRSGNVLAYTYTITDSHFKAFVPRDALDNASSVRVLAGGVALDASSYSIVDGVLEATVDCVDEVVVEIELSTNSEENESGSQDDESAEDENGSDEKQAEENEAPVVFATLAASEAYVERGADGFLPYYNYGEYLEDTQIIINGQTAYCMDYTTRVGWNELYSSTSLDSSLALRWSLYRAWLESNVPWYVDQMMQYIIWDETNARARGFEPAYSDYPTYYAQARSFYEANKSLYQAAGTYYYHAGMQDIAIIYSPQRLMGTVVLKKESAFPDITGDNPNYSLKGAEYGVYTDPQCTTLAKDVSGNEIILVTDAQGDTQTSGNVLTGTYYVREIKASLGYELDGTIYPVSVSSGVAKVSVKERPHSDPMPMWKVDADNYVEGTTPTRETNKPQGAASLEGAEFTVNYYYEHFGTVEEALAATPTRTWVFGTDGSGYSRVANEYYVSGDALYVDTILGNATIPIGTVLVWESKAPRGYILPETKQYHLTWVESGTNAAMFISEDSVVKQEVIVSKVDEATDGPVANTEFSLYRLDNDCVEVSADNEIVVKSSVDLDDESLWTFIEAKVTGADGTVSFGKLPIAYYRIVETRPNPEYATHTETIDGHSSSKVYPAYIAVDAQTGKQEQKFADKKITVECDVDKNTIKVTSAGFKYVDGSRAEVNNTGNESYRYDVDFSNASTNVEADEFWMEDTCGFTDLGLRIDKLVLPSVAQGTDLDGKVWLLIKTNKTTTGTASGMMFAQPELIVGSLCNSMRFDATGWDYWGEYDAYSRALVDLASLLGEGEYITGIVLAYGAITPGFSTTSPLSYLVHATHELEVGTVIPNTAESHISRNWSTITYNEEGKPVENDEATGLFDDDTDSVETTVIPTFIADFNRNLRSWGSGYGILRMGDNFPVGSMAVCAFAGFILIAAGLFVRRREEQ